jgi:hypothetical protein
MKEVFFTKIFQHMMKQKLRLILENPKLQNFFTHISLDIPEIKSQIPFLPIRCFRDFHLFHDKNSGNHVTFLSSGSTHSTCARHTFSQRRLKTYAQKSCEGFEEFLQSHNFSKKTPLISLIPPREVWPTSSLAAMISFFKNAGFWVEYCDIEQNPHNLLTLLHRDALQEEVVIFGTTFHHLMFTRYLFQKNIQKIYSGKKLALIHTGGTKGKTQSFSVEKIRNLFIEIYKDTKNFLFLSEYGMCELASQAWSVEKEHNGTFRCQKTLIPFAIDLKTQKILPQGDYGFLGFLDALNLESWPALITEDLGCLLNQKERIFKLKGRAPNATLKGCSLNLKEDFLFLDFYQRQEESSIKILTPKTPQPIKNSKDIHTFMEGLNPKIWTPENCANLRKLLLSWNDIQIKNPEKLKNKNLLIVSSANIPVAWLYPAKMASCMGARSVHIKLPSLREDDPFAEKVREKIEDLARHLALNLKPTNLILEKSNLIQKDFTNFHAMIVFGTDTTIKSFQKKLQGTQTKLIGQGHIQNSLTVTPQHSTEEIAELCSMWLGRGCLTPICLFLSERNEIQKWIRAFHLVFEQKFLNQLQQENAESLFLHDTQVAHTRAVIKNLARDPKEIILSGKATHVINLTLLNAKDILRSDLDFSFGGGGFIFILKEDLIPQFPQLSREKIVPALRDPHGGKTWEEWLDF